MKKFCVFSGFLGAGKTTAMMALTKYYTAHIAPAAMISNDLGEGVTLADHRLAALSGVKADEITGECICFCHDVLRARLDAFFDAGCELVCSDIPGFGVGALEHVYHGLTAEGRAFDLAPFTVLIEPRSVEILRARDGGRRAGSSRPAGADDAAEDGGRRAGSSRPAGADDAADGDMAHILRAQLMEADLIMLNKTDLVSPAQTAQALDFLAGAFPAARVLAISAATGAGLDALCEALRDGAASLRHPAIDYEGDALQGEMGSLSEYYLQYRALVCCDDFDGTAYLADIAARAQRAVAEAGGELPHLKLLAWSPDGDFGKADVLGVGRALVRTRAFARPCVDVAVVLNATAKCPPAALDAAITGAAEAASQAYNLEMTVFRHDCFGMGE